MNTWKLLITGFAFGFLSGQIIFHLYAFKYFERRKVEAVKEAKKEGLDRYLELLGKITRGEDAKPPPGICQCGCGQHTRNETVRYIKGHNVRGGIKHGGEKPRVG